ncbi:MAG: hypothetical protein EOP04_03585 [Proteobacteria bacterium]|nr:MAG: hypothetical protein EOP04_03585 [Pseudomonadota bacterium]
MERKAKRPAKELMITPRINYKLCWAALELHIRSMNNHPRLTRPADSLLTLMDEAKRIEQDDIRKAWEFLRDIIQDQTTNEKAPQHAALSEALLEDMVKIEEHCSLRIAKKMPIALK